MGTLSWGRWMAAGAVAAAGIVVPAPAPTQAAGGDIVAVVIEGTGFGHGRGMSQWGAYGYAVDHGWDWNQILDHYYGGTESGTVPADQRVRVRLTDLDGQGTIGVISHGSPITWNGQTSASMYAKETSTPGQFDVWGSNGQACPGASTLVVPGGAPVIATGAQGVEVEQVQQFLWTYQPTAGGIAIDGDFGNQTRGHLIDWQNAVGITLDGSWGPQDAETARSLIAADTAADFSLLGTEVTTTGNPLSFTIADGDGSIDPELTIGLCSPNRSITHYRGSIDVLSTLSGNRVVNDVSIQNYVRGVIPREVSASWGDAGDGAGVNALRAQAVAARSYGLEQRRSYFYDGASNLTVPDGVPAIATGAQGSTVEQIQQFLRMYQATVGGVAVDGDFGPQTRDHLIDWQTAVGIMQDGTWGPEDAAEARTIISADTSSRYATTCDTTACQVYGGAARRGAANGNAAVREDPRTDAAVATTANVVRRWPVGHPNAGQLVSTEFSASNGPRTAGGAFPAVNDIGDDTLRNPNHRWTRVIDADTLESLYGIGQLASASMVSAAASQYQGYDGIWFDDLVLTGKSGSKRMNSWDFRRDLNLPSPGFTVRVVREIVAPTRFGFIGDSVGSSIASASTSEFRSVIDGSFTSPTINAVSNRCTNRSSCSGTSGVDIAADLTFGLDLVVVELGYNDRASTFADDVDAMMVALTDRGVKQVAWVNLAEIRTNSNGLTYEPHNDALAAATGQWSNLTILDWNTASNDPGSQARWFSDGVHLTSTGRAEFSLWLFDETTTAAPSIKLSPPMKIVLPIHGTILSGTDGDQVTVPDSATAVALNITAFQPSGPGFVTVWPCGSDRPETSNLNYGDGQVIANNVLAPIDNDGTICLYSLVTTDVIVDVSGWFTAEAGAVAAGTGVIGVTPKRVVDTRLGLGWPGRVAENNPIVINVAGMTATRPDGTLVTASSDVLAVSLNVTATGPSGPGFLTAWPCDEPFPLAASVNYDKGETVGNGVFAGVDGDGQVCIYSLASTDVIVDVQGWVVPDQSTAPFTAVTPSRLVDTRSGRQVAASSWLTVPVHGAAVTIAGAATTVPTTATAAVVNVVVADPDDAGFVTVWPCAGDVPLAANLVYLSGDTRGNGVIAPIGPDGSICVYSLSSADIIVDISGWLSGPTPGSGGFTGAVPNRFVDTRFAIGPLPV
ncbi:MAG: SpoIID/LytB domain-containing protein [Ilumatobacter sp.]